MKKLLFLVAIALGVVATSCKKETIEPIKPPEHVWELKNTKKVILVTP